MVQSNVVIKSLLWKVGERVFVQGVGLLVQVILARLLMPEDFACLAIITAIVNYLGLFVQGGLAVAVVQKKDFTQRCLHTHFDKPICRNDNVCMSFFCSFRN